MVRLGDGTGGTGDEYFFRSALGEEQLPADRGRLPSAEPATSSEAMMMG